MHKARALHGLIKHGAEVFVFGGVKRTNPKLVFFGNLLKGRKHCEKFNILTESWTMLPPMNSPRYSFSPCYFEGRIYLPSIDRFEDMHLEAFDLRTNKFHILEVKLNALRDVPMTISYVTEGELVVFIAQDATNKPQKGAWKIGKERSFRFSECEKSVSASQCPPKEFGGQLYVTGLEGTFLSYAVTG